MERPQRKAREEERLTASLHGGRVTPASGSGTGIKNDVINDGWSFEVKSTSQKGYRLTRDDLAKAEKNALEFGRRMAFLVSFLPTGTGKARRYVVMTEDDFIEMIQG